MSPTYGLSLRLEVARGEPGPAATVRRLREPRLLDDLDELLTVDLAHPGAAQQHRRVAVEVRRGEERQALVLQQRLLVPLGGDPDDHDVVVALARLRVVRVGPRRPEEDERLAAHLVDGVLLRTFDAHVRHRARSGVDVVDRRRAAHVATAAAFARSSATIASGSSAE